MRGATFRAWAAAAIPILGFGCRGGEGAVAAPAPTARAVSGGSLLAPGFRPPADGVMTEGQVDAFLRVRRAAKGRTDAEASHALGVSDMEIAWTRARIVEALAALDDRRVRDASADVYAKTLTTLRETRRKTQDPARAKTLDEQIATLERQRSNLRRAETPGPALAGNMRVVARRRAEIEALAP